jgi:hypothetical protein
MVMVCVCVCVMVCVMVWRGAFILLFSKKYILRHVAHVIFSLSPPHLSVRVMVCVYDGVCV